METLEMRETSIFDVIRDLRNDLQSLIKNEIKLAKAELSQKASRFTRNAVWLAAGGVFAYTGLLILLAGIGALLTFAYASAGVTMTLAWFLGLGTVGLLSAVIGGVLVLKALKTFAQEPLSPERTVQTIKEIRGTAGATPQVTPPPPAEPKRSPAEIQSAIKITRTNMEKRMEELSERLKPSYMGKRFVRQIKKHPVRSSLIGAGTGVASYLAIKRHLHNHEK